MPKQLYRKIVPLIIFVGWIVGGTHEMSFWVSYSVYACLRTCIGYMFGIQLRGFQWSCYYCWWWWCMMTMVVMSTWNSIFVVNWGCWFLVYRLLNEIVILTDWAWERCTACVYCIYVYLCVLEGHMEVFWWLVLAILNFIHGDGALQLTE